jgi:hypothetical protein
MTTQLAETGKLSARHYLISVGISSILTVFTAMVSFKFPKYESLDMFWAPGMFAGLFLVPGGIHSDYPSAYLPVAGVANAVLCSLAILLIMKCGLLLRRKAWRRQTQK